MVDANVDADPAAEDLYERLGVDPADSTAEIEESGRRVLASLSPDSDLSAEELEALEEQYHRAKEAFDVLTDDDERAAYDRRRAREDDGGDRGTAVEGFATTTDRDGEPTHLDVSADTTEAVRGSEVTFTVTDGDGVPVSGAVVTVDESTGGTTDARGRVDLTVADVGTVEARATKPDAGSYRDDAVTLEVVREEVPLSLSVGSEAVEPDEAVAFVVRTDEGTPVEGATVEGRGRSAVTDERGRARLRFEEPGTVHVTATKEDTGTVRYRDAGATVDVARHAVPLEIDTPEVDLGAARITVGDEVAFVVRDDGGERVEGATVVARDTERTTDSLGTCRFTFAEPGTVEVTAAKDDPSTEYERDSVTFEVLGKGRLDLSAEKQSVETGRVATFEVVDRDGEPVEGATVEAVDRPAEAETDRRGRAELSFSEPGEVEVEASKGAEPTGYEGDSVRVMVRAAGPSVEPSERPRPGGTTTDGMSVVMALLGVFVLGSTVLTGVVLALDLPLSTIGGIVLAVVLVLLVVGAVLSRAG